ncbi:MAG: chemotaxis protein CheW [Myxococcota bacterium]|nr:chemotaxis protein CheW [Myxococcota bacterium]
MTDRRRQVDFQELYRRLDEADARLLVTELTVQQREELLQRRAREVARRLDTAQAPSRGVFVFSLGAQRCAVEMTEAVRAIDARTLTPLPGSAPQLAGLFASAGQVLCAFDLRPLLGLAEARLADLSWIVVVQPRGGDRFGLVVEDIQGQTEIDPLTVSAPPAGPYTGVTVDRILLLDLAQTAAAAAREA